MKWRHNKALQVTPLRRAKLSQRSHDSYAVMSHQVSTGGAPELDRWTVLFTKPCVGAASPFLTI
jgi:hypothetical protein